MSEYVVTLTETEMDVLRGAIHAASEEGLLGRRFSDYYGAFTDEARESVDTVIAKLGLKRPEPGSYWFEIA